MLICSAQNKDIQFRRLQPEKTLTDRPWINSIEQDANGFIWFDSVKYDGREARPYPNFHQYALKMGPLLEESWGKELDSLFYFDPRRDSFINNVPPGIPLRWRALDRPVFYCGDCFIKDASRNIWLGTRQEGVFIYDTSSKGFRKENHLEDRATSLSSNWVSALLKDRQGKIWVGTLDAGLNLWLGKGNFRRFRSEPDNPATLSSDTIYCMQQDLKGTIWMGTSQGLCRLDPVTATFQRIALPDSLEKTIMKIFVHSSGKLWLGMRGRKRPAGGKVFSQMAIYDPITEEVQASFNDLNIYWAWDPSFPVLVEDHLGRVWMVSEGQGIYIYDHRTNRLTQHRHDPRDVNSLSSNKVRQLHRDRHNRIWIGTFNGVSVYDPNFKLFHHYESDSEYKHFFNSENKFTGLEDPDGNIWFASRGAGLIKLDPVTHNIKVYQVEGSSSSETMRNDFIKIVSDDRGNIWGTTFSGALYTLNRVTEIFTLMPAKAHGGLAKDLQGRIWAGGLGGLFVFADPKSKPTFFGWDAMRGTKLQIGRGSWPTEIATDCDGMIWVSGDFPLFRFNPVDQSVWQFKEIPEVEYFRGLFFDRNCNLWMGSILDDGLFFLPKAEQSKPMPKIDHWHEQIPGIPHHNIRDILEDPAGKIWFGSSAGITQFDPDTHHFITYDQELGLKTKGNTIVRGKDGTIYNAGKNGIGHFHPGRLAENNYPPPVHLTDLHINGYSLVHNDSLPFASPLQESITYTQSIRLKHWQNELTFEFIALNYTLQENNQYEYQLIGYDQEPKTTDGLDPKATYTNLSPGSYTFRITAANNEGIWNNEGKTIEIVISPPWWQAWWALMFYAFLLLALVFAVGSYELRRRLTRAEALRLKELDQVKTRLYTNITHEFRTPLTVIQGIASQIRGHEPEKALIQRNSHQLLSLINQMLDLSKLESQSMPLRLQQADVVGYIKYLVQSFQGLAVSKSLTIHIYTQTDHLMMDFDAVHIAKVIGNLLSNAIKFTEAGGHIYVRLSTERDHLLIAVRDTGVGIASDQIPLIFNRFYQSDDSDKRQNEGTGIGLTLTSELVKLMRGDITVSSKLGHGSEFVVQLPITQEAKITSVHAASTAAFEVPVPTETGSNGLPLLPHKNPDLPTALIIEDNPDVVRYLARCLQRNYRLATAENGQIGIDKAVELVPDIIITDVMMSKKNGYEVTNTLKGDERTSHIPILMLTAKADPDSKIKGLEQGADAYLYKPFSERELEVRLAKLIELRENLRKRYASLSSLGATKSKHLRKEDQFIQKLKRTVEEHIDDDSFGITQLLREMGVSRTQMHNKIKALTGKSTTQAVRSIRLQKAKFLLESTDMNVSEVSHAVGFKNLSYFSTCFSEEFGLTPSAARKADNDDFGK